jgi:hypothetical protein
MHDKVLGTVLLVSKTHLGGTGLEHRWAKVRDPELTHEELRIASV